MPDAEKLLSVVANDNEHRKLKRDRNFGELENEKGKNVNK